MNQLMAQLADFAKGLDVDLFGAADLSRARDFVFRQGGEQIAGFPRAISIGMRLLDAVVDELKMHEEPSVLFAYRGLYNSVNANLDRAALLIARKVQQAGFKAWPISTTQTVNERRLEGAISHKLAAHLAGHGWIGKSCLLVTPECGPRVRLATILTNAPLQTGKPMPDNCKECRKCVDICPPNAFTGRPFDPSEPRDARFRAHVCRDYTRRRKELLGEGICGLCVYICPHGTGK